MESKRNWKAILALTVLAISVAQLLPTFVPGGMPDFYTAIFDKEISYGLDLKGGLELRYTVDYKKAIGDNALRLRDGLLDRLGEAAAKAAGKDWQTLSEADKQAMLQRFSASRTAFNALEVKFKDAKDQALLTTDLVATLDQRFELRKSDASANLFMPDKAVQTLKNEIVEQTLSVIRKRVDAFGLVEPDVRRSGDADIDLQLPGLSARQMRMVRERIGQAAQLTFRMHKEEAKVFAGKQQEVEAFKAANADKAKSLAYVPDNAGGHLRADHKSELMAYVKGVVLPDDVMIGYEFVEDRDPLTSEIKSKLWRTWNLTARTELTGDNLTRAAVGYGDKGEPVVNLEFDSRGARVFGELTEKNVGNQMGILLDDDVNSAPVIRERIGGGRAQITLGRGSSPRTMMDEAKALVTVLNNGAYKAPVIKVHDIEVGPSLGKDAVRGGLLSMAVGVLLVVAFMVVYYRQGGVIADIALVFNLLLQLACLVAFNAALTLPGMAGLTLTTAMAVDANILIFERVREELRLGRTVRHALDLGYSRAFWTIFDSHITAGIAGAVLMVYSTGPIYGFAVTLLIGIGTSMFTSIIGTRVIYDWLISKGKLQELSV
jgi:preprotein translocase subunit SecD